jgi:hypothetical protein
MNWEGAKGGREVPKARRVRVVKVSRTFWAGRRRGAMWRDNAGMVGTGVESLQVVGPLLGRHDAGVPRAGGEVFSVPSREGVGRWDEFGG